MKEKIDNLYIAKCRYCIMDIINSYYDGDKEIVPRPDFVDYYTILYKRNDKYMDIFDLKKNILMIENPEDVIEFYNGDIILEIEPLSNYIEGYEKLSTNQCELVLSTLVKTRKLTENYGYKNR